MSQLSTFYSPLTAADLGLGNAANVTFGSVTTGAVTASGPLSGTGFTNLLAAPPAIGNITPAAITATTLSANNGTLTASAPVLDLAQTWNNAAVAFTGLRFNATDTASSSNSSIAEFQLNGASYLRIQKEKNTGLQCVLDVGATTNASMDFQCGGNRIFRAYGAGAGAQPFYLETNGGLQFAPISSSTSSFRIEAEAANTLAARQGTAGQTFNIYNTFTNASNHERLRIGWASNVAIIGTEKAGTGSARALEFQVDGTTRFALASTGRITINPNDGASGDGVTITSSRSGGNARALVITDGGITCTGGQARFLFGADVVNTSNVLNNFNNALCLLLRRTSGGTGNFIDLQDSSNVSKLLIDNNANFVLPTSGGVKIGTGTTQLLGFWNAAPAVQPAAVADATDAASTQARLNDLLARLRTIGIIAT